MAPTAVVAMRWLIYMAIVLPLSEGSYQYGLSCWQVQQGSKISPTSHIGDYKHTGSVQACQQKCQQTAGCCSASFTSPPHASGKDCWLHRSGSVMGNVANFAAITSVCSPCNYAPVQGWSNWSEWSKWGACPVTCGTAVQIRLRLQSPCRAIYGHCDGPADEVEVKACGTDLCVEGKKNCWQAQQNSKIEGIGSAGHIRDFYNIKSQQECEQKCEQEAGCCSMSFNGQGCWLHRYGAVMSNVAGFTAITNVCPPCNYEPAEDHAQLHAQASPQCKLPYNSFTDHTRIETFNDGRGGVSYYDNTKYGDKQSPDWKSQENSGWYRFTGAAGTHMAEKRPTIYSCGTNAPLYLQGTHPTVAEGIVQRTVCAIYGAPPRCYLTRTISVVNCGAFYIYKLPDLPGGDRYCGSNE